jgi:hypothetical protein
MVAKRPMTPLSALDTLRAMIAADTLMQDRLALFMDAREFADAAAREAQAAGFRIDPEAIVSACRPDPLGIDRFGGGGPTADAWPSRGWLPAAVVLAGNQLAVDWAHFGNMRLNHSFFEDSLRANRPRPINRLMKLRTPLGTLADTMPSAEDRAPDALIFHMSRCGSTLVSQMIAAMPTAVVVSEAPPLDAIVDLAQARPDIPFDVRVSLLRAMASALGRDRFGDREQFVIKLDSWHSLALPLFRAAFPATPWLFLFRDPVEVMVSHERMQSSQMLQGLTRPGLYRFDDSVLMPPLQFCARALASVCAAAIEHRGLGGGLLVDYAELPHAVETRILPHFGITPDASALATIRATATRDAKASDTGFTADSERKQAEASVDVRAAAKEHLASLYRELQAAALAPATP